MLLGDGNDAVILWAGFANCADKQIAFEVVALKPFNMPVIDFLKRPCLAGCRQQLAGFS
jgi:hypothetical protein